MWAKNFANKRATVSGFDYAMYLNKKYSKIFLQMMNRLAFFCWFKKLSEFSVDEFSDFLDENSELEGLNSG